MKRICPQCGAEMNENAQFCGKCGAKYEVKQENTNKCQKCGHPLDGQMKFCPNCGFHVENEKKVTNDSFEKVKETISENTARVGNNIADGISHEKAKIKNGKMLVENRNIRFSVGTVIKIIIVIIVVITIYNNFFNEKDSPEAAVALQVAKNDMGSGFSESDIEFDVVAAKDDSKFIVRCKAVSDEAQEMYELVYDRDICFYGVEFGNASGQYFTTIGESERDVKDKMDW